MSLHRFLQVDNYIHDPTNTQNYNQYGYVLNNPLLYTDPSGNAFNDGKDCVNCGVNYPAYNPDKMQYNKPLADGLHRWVGGWSSARNIDEAGTAVGKAARDAVNFIGRNIRSLFGGGHRSSGPSPNMSSYANLNTTGFTGQMGINNFNSNLTHNVYRITPAYSLDLREGDWEKVAGKTNEITTSITIITASVDAVVCCSV